MNTIRCIFCALLAASLISRFAFAKGLSDLAEFAQSAGAVERIFNEPEQKAKYRRALERYGSQTKDFDHIFEKLKALRGQVDGLGERLSLPKKPLVIELPSHLGGAYRFEKVLHPLHAVWLLQNLRDSDRDVCSDRDSLLVDKWTPILRDTSVFAVEKGGRYLGHTITLVPIKSASAAYLLVVPSGGSDGLPRDVIESFVREHRRKEPSSTRFAMLTPLEGKKGAYQISRIDDKGRATDRLGPVEGFKLSDPMAQQIVSFAPAECTPGARGTASLAPGVGGGGGASGAGNVKGGKITEGPDIVVNANPNLNAKTVVNVGSGGGGGVMSNPSSPGTGMAPVVRNGGGAGNSPVTTNSDNRKITNNNIVNNNGVAAPPSAIQNSVMGPNNGFARSGDRPGASAGNGGAGSGGRVGGWPSANNFGGGAGGVGGGRGLNSNSINGPVNFGGPGGGGGGFGAGMAQNPPRGEMGGGPSGGGANSGGGGLSGIGGVVGGRGGAATASALPGAGGGGTGATGGGIDPSKLSPEDRRVHEAIEAGRKAAREKRPIPRDIAAVIDNAAFNGVNEALKGSARQAQREVFHGSNQLHSAYEMLSKKDPSQRAEMLQHLNNDFCRDCPDCPYCVRLREELGGGVKQQ